MQWWFHWADRAAIWTLVLGAALLAAACVLGALAFANRGLRYASFVAGWRLMTVSSAVEVVLQSAMLVWLSFWLTAYFWHSYYIKLVGLAGIMRPLAVFLCDLHAVQEAAFGLRHRRRAAGEADAPRLWDRIRQLAGRVRPRRPTRSLPASTPTSS
jgi:hypothetical protein